MIWDRKRISFEHVPTLMKIEAQTSCWIINYMIDRVIPPTSDIYFSLRLLNPCLNCKIQLRNTGKRNFQTIKLDLAIKWSALNALKAWRFTVNFFFLSEMQILKTVEFCVKNCLNIFKRVSVSADRHEEKKLQHSFVVTAINLMSIHYSFYVVDDRKNALIDQQPSYELTLKQSRENCYLNIFRVYYETIWFTM